MNDRIKKVRPLGARVVLEVLPKETVSPSGIFIPGSVKGREDKGRVLAVGPDCAGVEPGDVVQFDPYQVQLVIDVDGYDMTGSMHAKAGAHAIVPESALLGVFE